MVASHPMRPVTPAGAPRRFAGPGASTVLPSGMRAAAVALVLTLGGCTGLLPVGHSLSHWSDEDEAPRSKVSRCELGYYLAGLAIDSVVVAADVKGGEEFNGLDIALLAPMGLVAVVATIGEIECLAD